MSVWSFLKLTIFLWLLRKMIKAFGWLLLAAAVVAAWPVTLVAAVGYAAAWLRGWPPARLAQTAAWALILAGTWTALQGARLHAWQPAVLAPARIWERSWSDLAAVDLGRVFLLLAPVAVPAGLALAGLADLRDQHRAGRDHGVGADPVRCLPVAPPSPHRQRADCRPRRRPAAGQGRANPGRRDHPRHRAPLAPRVQPPLYRVRPAHGHRRGDWIGEDEPDDAAVGGMVHRRPGRRAGG